MIRVGDVIERVHDQAGGGCERPGDRVTVARVKDSGECEVTDGARRHWVHVDNISGHGDAAECKWHPGVAPWKLSGPRVVE